MNSAANNVHTAYSAPIKVNNGANKRTYTRRRANAVQIREKNAATGALFTRSELRNLINKSIYFLYKMKQKSLNQNVSLRSGKIVNLFNLSSLYERLIAQLPIISNGRQHNRVVPVIKFQYNNVYHCGSHEKCIDNDAIDKMEIKCAVVKGVDVAYILYDGERMSAIAKEPTFINSLTEKEAAFMKLIFDNANVLTEDGFRLAGFQAENIGEQLNVIVNKNRTARLRFSNKVHIKEIPNRKTMRNMIRNWSK